ncbi:hypothetical protein OHA21_00355 [Actinoplanes sp. NBC_00393]|uniref:hypothetical protein n=1 Tax=Actinoplanes sp. NBC_00393 TaxID=2975953 RepID=UPI002E203CCF
MEDGGMAEDVPDAVKLRKDLLWGLYTDLQAHARHAETLRSTVVNFMVVIASVLVAAVVRDGSVDRADLIPCAMITIVGAIGLIFAAGYTELHERNRRRAMLLRATLDDEHFAGEPRSIRTLLATSDREHQQTPLYRWTRGLSGSTRQFWLLLPGLLLVAGIALTAVSL